MEAFDVQVIGIAIDTGFWALKGGVNKKLEQHVLDECSSSFRSGNSNELEEMGFVQGEAVESFLFEIILP